MGTGYRKIYPTFAPGSVIAAAFLVGGSTTGTLEYLEPRPANVPPFTLSPRAETDNVQVAPALPPSALFIDDPSSNGIGTLKFVDLSATPPRVVSISGGTAAPASGMAYGATGHQFLFVAGFSSFSGLGTLKWSDGATVRDIGPRATAGDLAFSADRTRAVTVLDIDPNTLTGCVTNCGRGKLVSIDMATGTVTDLASDAFLRGIATDLAFSISGDGSTVAYTAGDGTVWRVSATGAFLGGTRLPCATPSCPVGVRSGSPALTADGQTVVYHSSIDADPNSAANGWYAFQAGSATATKIAQQRNQGCRPRLSPNGQWAVYFTTVVNADGGLVGNAWIAPTAGGSAPALMAAYGSVESLRFNAASTRVSIVGDLTNIFGDPSHRANGNLYSGPVGQTLTVLGSSVQVMGVALIPATEALAYVGDLMPGVATGTLYLAPGLGATGGTVSKTLVVPNSTIGRTVQASRTGDGLLFIADPPNQLFENRYRIGPVWGTTTQGPARALPIAGADAIQAVFDRDGRADVVIVAGPNAGVWTLPPP